MSQENVEIVRTGFSALAQGEEAVVIVTGHWTGEGTVSGVQLETPFSSAPTLRDGRVVRYEWFREKAEALEAARLQE